MADTPRVTRAIVNAIRATLILECQRQSVPDVPMLVDLVAEQSAAYRHPFTAWQVYLAMVQLLPCNH
jgi:hypothetical protein